MNTTRLSHSFLRDKAVLLLAALSLSLFSCSSDNSDDVAVSNVPNGQYTSLSTDLKAMAASPTLKTMLVAHRANTYSGIQDDIPENSIPGIERCIEEGVDMIEIDPRATSDGVLILMHNAKLDATTTSTGAINAQTYRIIQSHYLTVNGKVTKYRIPTLSEALDAAKDRIYVCIDVKEKEWLTDIVKMVVEKGMTDQVCYYTGEDTSYLDVILNVDKNGILLPWVSYGNIIPQLHMQYPSLMMFQTGIGYSAIDQMLSEARSEGIVNYVNYLDYDDKMLEGDFSKLDDFISKGIQVMQSDYCDLLIPKMKEGGYNIR